MDGKILARVGAIGFVTFAITATAIELSSKDEAPLYRNVAAAIEPGADPLKTELRRCQLLGEAGPRDPACLQAWADNRDRFLKPSQGLQPPPPPPASSPQDQLQTPPAARDPAVNESAPATGPHTNQGR